MELAFAAAARASRAAADPVGTFQPCSLNRGSVTGKRKTAWIDQSPADGCIKELGLVEPKDKVKGIIVWKVDALHERKEL